MEFIYPIISRANAPTNLHTREITVYTFIPSLITKQTNKHLDSKIQTFKFGLYTHSNFFCPSETYSIIFNKRQTILYLLSFYSYTALMTSSRLRQIILKLCMYMDTKITIFWRCRRLNPEPFTCKANALPLSYMYIPIHVQLSLEKTFFVHVYISFCWRLIGSFLICFMLCRAASKAPTTPCPDSRQKTKACSMHTTFPPSE